MKKYDAVVVGSGPNGLAAAIRLAQANLSILLIEAKNSIGGGMRSGELTLPGFIHDICSAVHPLGIGSPFNYMAGEFFRFHLWLFRCRHRIFSFGLDLQ